MTYGRICPICKGPKNLMAKQSCRACRVYPKSKGYPGLTGPNHPCWKGGFRIDKDGYIRTYKPDHPWPRRGGYVLEHVRVMELHLGRKMSSDEAVHHKDHNRQNNALDNLEVITRSLHSSLHRKLDQHLRKRDYRGRYAGKEVSICQKNS